jgi:FHS family L-fucose permease-like MFS transporter
MVATVAAVAAVLLSVGIVLPDTSVTLSFLTTDPIPLGIVLFVFCGLCTSVMWGAIFNLAVEGLGKYTSIASGLFMVMVCGGGIVPFIQGLVVDGVGFMTSFWVLVAAVAFILWFALSGSKIKK